MVQTTNKITHEKEEPEEFLSKLKQIFILYNLNFKHYICQEINLKKKKN